MGEGMMEIIQGTWEFVLNPHLLPSPLYDIWRIGRIVFVAFSIFLLGMIIYLLHVNEYLIYRFKENFSERVKGKPHHGIKIEKNWKEIMEQAKDDREAERKLAVIEADDTINEVLGKLGYEGDSLLEKLDGLNKEIIPNIEEVRDAHRRRRDIVYDPDTSLSKEDAVKIVSLYEEVFKDMQLL